MENEIKKYLPEYSLEPLDYIEMVTTMPFHEAFSKYGHIGSLGAWHSLSGNIKVTIKIENDKV